MEGQKPKADTGVGPLSVSELQKQLFSDHIYLNIGRQLRRRFPGAVIIVSQRVPDSDVVRLRFYEGFGSFLDAIFNMLGRRFEDMDFKADSEALTVMPSGKVYQLTGGFFQLALGEVPYAIAGLIENILAINKIYAVAFVRNQEVLGTAVLILRHKDDISETDKTEIEAYSKECAILLEEVNSKTRVLFLDDELNILDMVKEMLLDEGFDVSVASSGNEAVTSYKNKMKSGYKYDIVITDVTLGRGMNGIKTAAEILKLDTHASLICCTGNILGDAYKNYKSFGYKSFLKKPFTIEEIQEAIKTAGK